MNTHLDVIPVDAKYAIEHESNFWRVLRMVGDFCSAYGSEDTGIGLAKEIIDALHMEYPTTLVWLALDEDGLIRAYCVASIRQRGKVRWVEISQLEGFDSAECARGLVEGFKKIEKWGATFGATEVRLATLCEGDHGKITSSRARLFESMYGFHPHRILMSKPIEESKDE